MDFKSPWLLTQAVQVNKMATEMAMSGVGSYKTDALASRNLRANFSRMRQFESSRSCERNLIYLSENNALVRFLLPSLFLFSCFCVVAALLVHVPVARIFKTETNLLLTEGRQEVQKHKKTTKASHIAHRIRNSRQREFHRQLQKTDIASVTKDHEMSLHGTAASAEVKKELEDSYSPISLSSAAKEENHEISLSFPVAGLKEVEPSQAEKISELENNSATSAHNDLPAIKTIAAKETAKGSSAEIANKSKSVESSNLIIDKANQRVIIGKSFFKYSPDAELYVGKDGIFVLRHGDLVADAAQAMLIKVGSSRVLMKPKTTLLISNRDGALKVRNMQESRAFSAHVFVNKRRFALCAGEELVSSANFDNLQNTASADCVKRRQVKTYELADGTNVMCAEFAPITVLKNNALLKAMAHSADKDEAKVFGKVMKMAACIATVMRAHGEYAPIAAPEPSGNLAYSGGN
jgi:hypothetical protein